MDLPRHLSYLDCRWALCWQKQHCNMGPNARVGAVQSEQRWNFKANQKNAEWSEWSVDTFVMCLWEYYFASLLHDAQTKAFDHKRLRTFKNHRTLESATNPRSSCDMRSFIRPGHRRTSGQRVLQSMQFHFLGSSHWTHRLKRCKSWSSTKERLRRAGPRNTCSGSDVHVLWYQQHHRKHFGVHLRK